LHTADNVAENYCTNSWCFDIDDVGSAGANLTPILKAWYDGNKAYLSPVLANSGHEIKYSLLPGTPPNYPFDTDLWSFSGAVGGTALPDELAVCLSFQGVKGAGFPQARRRGRTYLGPLNTTAATSNRPATALLSNMASQAINIKAAVNALAGNNDWCVWSVADQIAVPVANGWIDNAFDVQRRRGVDYTSRTLWA
jgi:hypothetical protein